MSKAQLKKHLNTLEKPQIIEMVMELSMPAKRQRSIWSFMSTLMKKRSLKSLRK
jgi:hypothetical protein